MANLPWEVLHDGQSFLIERETPLVVPVRWLDKAVEMKPVQQRSLQILFMATSPEGVEPVLDFEQEEASILRVTQDLPLSLRVEESGCVAELNKFWKRYPEGTFDVFHLTGHASVRGEPDYSPYFITETITGERQETTVAELAKVFGVRQPRLVFLSGCRTGQAGNSGLVLSLAAALVQRGILAVLGWGRPVADSVATAAAAHLYEQLAAGCTLSQAVGLTHRHLRQEVKVKDWHLLRLYVRGEAWGELVEPPGDYQPLEERVQPQFLDKANYQVRVAGPEQFVGRRRTIQACLRALRVSENTGVMLYGLGGVGKTTTAARILERMPNYQPLVVNRELDADKLEQLLAVQCTSEIGNGILNGQLPLMQRLTQFLMQGLNQPEQKFVFFLDNFEANLEFREDGEAVLGHERVEVLMALLQAIVRSRCPHRVIVTSRYDFTLPQLNQKFYRQPLSGLRGADWQKKCDRLLSFRTESEVGSDLQQQAKAIADGNPRLLEWLDKVLQDRQLDQSKILEQLAARAAQFRESTLVEEVLKQQTQELQQMLSQTLVFELPIPWTVVSAACTGISNLEQHRQRAVALGLLEYTSAATGPIYRVPRILEQLLPKPNEPTMYENAIQELYRVWWIKEARTEEQELELYRLAQWVGANAMWQEVGDALVVAACKHKRSGLQSCQFPAQINCN